MALFKYKKINNFSEEIMDYLIDNTDLKMKSMQTQLAHYLIDSLKYNNNFYLSNNAIEKILQNTNWIDSSKTFGKPIQKIIYDLFEIKMLNKEHYNNYIKNEKFKVITNYICNIKDINMEQNINDFHYKFWLEIKNENLLNKMNIANNIKKNKKI